MEHLALDSSRPVVLVVDDDPGTLNLMNALLTGRYRIKLATSGRKALEIVHADPPPDLALLDIMMPDLDGYEVCRQLKADAQTCEIPVIFLTARAEVDDERQGFALGAADYITKPISPPILLARIETHLMLKRAADQLRQSRERLDAQKQHSRSASQIIDQGAALLLASVTERRGLDASHHALRTQAYLRALVAQMITHPRYREALAGLDLELFCQAALLRDLGMLGIPESIQCKPAALTPSEQEWIARHPELGEAAIARLEQIVGEPHAGFALARVLARHHHEKWDGSGYPDRLAGEAIPLVARLMAIVDVYGALTSERPYRQAYTREQALGMMVAARGNQFEPALLDGFVVLAPALQQIAEQFGEAGSQP
ncbi:response regulator [Aeromonas finlandensis]|uniref:response regulator n=1 Tax=Aeromonas finlandensis TaxID=1543375 RepID=UPI00051B226F|nr:HD domain-containing phosphohydrolase [Aeromonas finlandensis]